MWFIAPHRAVLWILLCKLIDFELRDADRDASRKFPMIKTQTVKYTRFILNIINKKPKNSFWISQAHKTLHSRKQN